MIKNQPHLISSHGGYRDLKSFQHANHVESCKSCKNDLAESQLHRINMIIRITMIWRRVIYRAPLSRTEEK